jgi:hypothetical protein
MKKSIKLNGEDFTIGCGGKFQNSQGPLDVCGTMGYGLFLCDACKARLETLNKLGLVSSTKFVEDFVKDLEKK